MGLTAGSLFVPLIGNEELRNAVSGTVVLFAGALAKKTYNTVPPSALPGVSVKIEKLEKGE